MTVRRVLLVMLLALGACQGGSGRTDQTRAAPPLQRLRIAMVEAAGPGAAAAGRPCVADAPDWPGAKRAYVRHLAERMAVPVTVCPVASRGDAARALAERRADIALLDPASYAPYKASLRPILTERVPMDLGRVEVVLAVPDTAPLRTLADADRATLLFAGTAAPRLAGPRLTLVSAGIPAETLARARVLGGPAEADAALRATPGAVAAYLSADWSRLCRGMSKGDQPCRGLRELWRGRLQANTAWVVRRDIPLESWARLVGIHVALFQEKPDVARWLAPNTREIEPTEATALDPIRAKP